MYGSLDIRYIGVLWAYDMVGSGVLREAPTVADLYSVISNYSAQVPQEKSPFSLSSSGKVHAIFLTKIVRSTYQSSGTGIPFLLAHKSVCKSTGWLTRANRTYKRILFRTPPWNPICVRASCASENTKQERPASSLVLAVEESAAEPLLGATLTDHLQAGDAQFTEFLFSCRLLNLALFLFFGLRFVGGRTGDRHLVADVVGEFNGAAA